MSVAISSKQPHPLPSLLDRGFCYFVLFSTAPLVCFILSCLSHWCLFVETSPDFTVPLKDVSAVVGDTVTLTCEASKPNASANWLKDGKPFSFKDKKKYKVSADGTTHTLTIPKSEVEDSAEFTCSINGGKTQSKVTVEGTVIWSCPHPCHFTSARCSNMAYYSGLSSYHL